MILHYVVSIPLLFLFAQDSSPPQGDPRMTQIMEKVVKKAVDNNELKKVTLRYLKHYTKEDLNEDGTRKSVRTETYLIRPNEDRTSSVEQLIEKDGKEVTDSKPKPNLSTKNQGVDITSLTSPDKFIFFPSEKKNLHIWEDEKKTRYITLRPIDFAPRSDFPINQKADHVLSRMTGTLYVSDDYHIWKVEAEMVNGLTAWKLGGLHVFELTIERKKIGNIMVTDITIVIAKYKILFLDWYERHIYTYDKYEKAPR